MKPRRYIALIFILLAAFKSISQDIHFSQFNGSLLNISPGYTGLFSADYRIGAIYRSQWQTVPVSYQTFSMNGEARIKPKRLEKDMIGIGLVFNNDRAGDARYGSTQFYANANYIYLAKPDSSLMLTLGMNLGWCQVGFDYNKMTFDNQFDGLAYNKGLGSGEGFGWTVRNYADISLGSAIQHVLNRRHKFTYAIGLHHLTKPVITFQGNDLNILDFKMTHCFSYNTAISDHTDIIAEALLSLQGKYVELIPHVSLKYYLNKRENQAVLAGLCYRTNDAAVLRLGYSYNRLQSGMSYDINVSDFNAATNRRGGFEIFLNYIIKVKPSFIAKKRACPVFM